MASQQSDSLSIIDSGQSRAPCSSSQLLHKNAIADQRYGTTMKPHGRHVLPTQVERCSGDAHSIDIMSSQAAKVLSQQTSIKEAMARGQETSYKRRRLAEEPDTEHTMDPAVLEHLYVRWIMSHHVAIQEPSPWPSKRGIAELLPPFALVS
ncbi:hypothetical protein VC83_08272 [Pseudogymnoascus destructans]|uniref:Uncharacterized protein n=1 Tax=Pseudogymnoascus destructans TaxID=655981 RepID=A0A177A1G7_9PEZI|nr:uncharacterized protein VC83_08272 [Pseudogymnoascus destructans]OAF55430.2 hypothetical protein VC83_08272 [Pseudogymnoascus destructans]